MADNAVSASAKGATFLILLQVISRAITFALNQILLRFLSPELLGASVQLEVFKIGVQYFSREALRVAAERRSDGGVQASINLSYLAIMACLPIGAGFAQWYLAVSYVDVPYFADALRLNQLAAFLELCMEPAFTAVQHNLLYRARAAAEGASVILKTLTVFGLFFWAQRQGLQLGVLPFSVGELVNSITLTTVYWLWSAPVARQKSFSLFPQKIASSPQVEYVFSLFSKPLLHLVSSLFFQTGIKWLLTEGDKLLIAALASLEDQGMYALSANYGGLIARMIFQPIETASRNLFANLCAAPSQPPTSAKDTATEKDEPKPSPDAKIASAAQILHDILRVYTTMSLFFFSVGPYAAPILLRLVVGSRWSDSGAGDVLGTYCFYIPFLAINGVSEAFVAATASTTDLRNQSLYMAGFSALFAASAYVFLRVLELGAKGLVLANCVNMALRIVFNLTFVINFFRRHGQDFDVKTILPSIWAVTGALIVPSLLKDSHNFYFLRSYGLLGELCRIGVIAGIFGFLVVWSEHAFWLDWYRTYGS